MDTVDTQVYYQRRNAQSQSLCMQLSLAEIGKTRTGQQARFNDSTNQVTFSVTLDTGENNSEELEAQHWQSGIVILPRVMAEGETG